ncbi:hypothetical protein GVY41_15500 [Frigidibacter albus]|uniref:Uncharacterized protein n=1 Tax=Frigidibacter albus TaxID=1465486 RepID=A0A6L8VJV7_9RHOB|nr:hypothetical protein [Frigidibacter albus]MZQ90473.1 hypothetical protein [Frigidibacter albus]NBE32407.1 hypothetical protein [Frigidibacter albus]GGH59605.1 hypothetical protein GCM10011341_31050 [Frigidibacter albus]
MRLLTLLALLLAVIAAAAFATRPGPAEFDATLEAAIRDRVANTDVGEGSGDPFAQIALVGCKLRPSDCIHLVRDSLDVTFEDRPFTTRVTVEGLNRTATCTGAFGRFFCKELLEG